MRKRRGYKGMGRRETPFPRPQFMVKCVPHLRYPKGRTGTERGTHVTTQKSTETESEGDCCC